MPLTGLVCSSVPGVLVANGGVASYKLALFTQWCCLLETGVAHFLSQLCCLLETRVDYAVILSQPC